MVAEEPYQAGSWPRERRVVCKAEALEIGLNTRFVVNSRGDRSELCIKDLKEGCFADRLICHRFWANQFRLLLYVFAYWPLDTVRRWLARLNVPHLHFGTPRLRLNEIGGWARQHLGTVSLHLASSHPGEWL